jgi:hypothetical protein
MKKLLFAFVLLFTLQQGYAQRSNKAKMQKTYDAIKAAGIRHPEIVMGQAIQETGWLNCKKCCYKFNNLFGFILKGNKCKKFSSQAECIAYYKTWQDKRYDKWRKKYPKEDYYHFLKYVRYATGDKYTAEVKPKTAWVKKNLKL